jgi:ABC-type amino acid transport substrate-binding protein
MKESKTILIAFIAVLAVALVAACGGGQQPTPTPIPPAPTNTPNPDLATPVPDSKPVVGDLWEQIAKRGSILVGTSADYPPFEYYDDNFELDGFDIELMRAIAGQLSLKVEFTDMAFDGLGDAADLGQIDIAIAAIGITPEREQYYDFSQIYYVSEDAYLAADAKVGPIATIEDLAGYRVGVQSGSVFQNRLEDQLVSTGSMPQTNLFVYQLIDQSFDDLKAGRVDIIVMDKQPAMLASEEQGFKIVAEGLNKERYAIGMAKGQNTLRTRINQALLTLQDEGFIVRLAKQYLKVDKLPALPTPTPLPPNPTATPVPPPAACKDGMAWVADLTYDDDSMRNPPVLQPGEPFQKGWRVRNTGTCTWDNAYILSYVRGNQSGAQMGGQPVAVQGTVAPGATYDFYVDLVAPLHPGTYQGFWQVRNGQGHYFGQTVYVGIRVPAAPAPTPVPTQTPSPDINFWADSTNLNQGQCTNIHWDVQNVNEVYLYQDGENWQNHGVAGQGTRQECPAQTTNYNLRVVKRDNSVEIRKLTIYVQGGSAPVIAHFTVDPPAIQLGQPVTIRWDIQGNVTNVKLTRDGATLWDGAPFRGSYQDTPPQSGSVGYGIEATGPGGTNRTTKYITVTDAPPTTTPSPGPIIYNFTVSPTELQVNDCVAIAWSTGGGTTRVTLKRNGQIVQDNAGLNGQEQDCLGAVGTYNFQLVAADNTGQTSTQDVNVQVVQTQPPTPTPEAPPVITFFAVTSDGTNVVSQVNLGDCVFLTWGFQGTSLAATSLSRNGVSIYSDFGPNESYKDCLEDPALVGTVQYRLKVDSEFSGSATRDTQVEVIGAQPK